MPRKKTLEDFIAESKAIYGDKYTYDHAVYIGAREPITLTCPDHGDFTVRADNHLCRGTGCPECAKPAKMANLVLGPISRLDHTQPNVLEKKMNPELCKKTASHYPKERLLKEREAEKIAAGIIEEKKPEPVSKTEYQQPYSGSAALFW